MFMSFTSMNIYRRTAFRLPVAFMLGLISLMVFTFSLFRPIPYSRSYFFALFGWFLLSCSLVLWRSFLSMRIEAYRVLISLAWLCPTLLLITLPQAFRAGFGARSALFLLSVGFVFGVPILMTVKKLSSVREKELRESFIQCIVLVVSLSLLFGVLELSMRIMGHAPYKPVEMTESFATRSEIPGLMFQLKPNHRWGIRYPSDPRGVFGEDNTVSISTNSLGYRDSEFVTKKRSTEFRIALLGDSLGFGYGVRKENGVADRIEEILWRMTGTPVEVYNFSVIGYSTVEEAILLEKRILDYEPDAVIIWFYINDPEHYGVMEDIQSDYYKVFPKLRNYSSVLYLVGSRFDNMIPRSETIEKFRSMYRDEDPRWVACENSLQRMGRIGSENGLPVYLFFHPVLYNLKEGYLFRDIHNKVIETAARCGIIAYDLLDVFEGQDARTLWVHPQDMHPNEIAHEMAAEYVASRLYQKEFNPTPGNPVQGAR